MQKAKENLKLLWLGKFTPHEIALGFAIGTCVALLPTFGFGVFIVALILFFFPTVNKPAALLALVVWNPIVQIPIYTLSYHFGDILYSGMPVVRWDIELLNQIHTFTRRFLVGHAIITITLSLISYVALYVFARGRYTNGI